MRVEVKMLTSGTNKRCRTEVIKQTPSPHPIVKSDLQTKMLEPDFNARKFYVKKKKLDVFQLCPGNQDVWPHWPTSHEATSAEEKYSSPSLHQSRLPNSHPNHPHPQSKASLAAGPMRVDNPCSKLSSAIVWKSGDVSRQSHKVGGWVFPTFLPPPSPSTVLEFWGGPKKRGANTPPSSLLY